MDLLLAINRVQSLVTNFMIMKNGNEEFKNIYHQSVESDESVFLIRIMYMYQK